MAWDKLLVIGIAGGFGAVSRYFLSRSVGEITNSLFPWGTLVVNVTGCLLFGIVWGLSENSAWLTDKTRIMILIGFLGAFTTFSSFAYESIALMREHQWWTVFINILAQNVGGMAAVLIGMTITRSS